MIKINDEFFDSLTTLISQKYLFKIRCGFCKRVQKVSNFIEKKKDRQILYKSCENCRINLLVYNINKLSLKKKLRIKILNKNENEYNQELAVSPTLYFD